MVDDPVVLVIDGGRIIGFEGPDAKRVEDHYDYVADLFQIDGRNVHSWHAGIHPKTWYDQRVADSLTRWGTVAFNSPRYTHFHTCGDYPPGEISPVLIDATITFDDEILWQDGRFAFLDRNTAVDQDGFDATFRFRADIGSTRGRSSSWSIWKARPA